MTGSSTMNSAQENGVHCLPTHRHCHVTDAQRAPLLLRSTHGTFRPTATPFPQPDAVHRFGRVGTHARRGSRDGSQRPDRPAYGIVGRVSHGTAQLPSSQRYYLTAKGIGEAAETLGFETPSDFVRAYPMSREWLTLLIRKMDAVASIYQLAASMSPGIDGLRSHVEFHRRGRFDATITLHDGRDFGVVRQGLALRRRSLYDLLRAIAEYDYTRRPDTVLILTPSIWEERLTTRFCEERNLRECFVAVESKGALERRDPRLWCCTSWVIGSRFFTLEAVSSHSSHGGRLRTESPSRKRASIPDPERMAQAAPTSGISPSEKRTLGVCPTIRSWRRQTPRNNLLTTIWALSWSY